MNFHDLVNRHKGETCWIVGKGPSLEYLRAEHFQRGPVIALNQSIVMIEKLDLSNPVYALQKDGCGYMGPHSACVKRDGVEWMIRPKNATLILRDTVGYSRHCLADYEPRVLVCPVRDLGFEYLSEMAIRMAISISKKMGCTRVKLMCCGSLVNGDTRTFNVWTNQPEHTSAGRYYLPVRNQVLMDLAGIPHSFFIPRRSA